MNDDAATLLVVADDDSARTFLADNLTADGYTVLVADSARDAIRELESKFPDLVLVNDELPDSSGFDVVRRVRAADGLASRVNPATPLLVISTRVGELARVRAFEAGADDVVERPFGYPELRMRVGALLWRAEAPLRGKGRMRVGDLEIDVPSRDVVVRGHRVDLSQKEFALLRALATEPTRVFTKEELLRTVWGFKAMGSTRTLDSHACRLRGKLAVDGDKYVLNVWGE
ncbi:MAG TPA: response regulator transcription factor [Solirubrobacteraceae bacterium]|nr:response regulator transcription factor [Solirubrobacteraceae bacterium]